MPFADVSRSELADRRRKLRRQRKIRIMQASWRLLFLLGIASGSMWVISLPAWVIRQPQQVVVGGNQLLTTAAVQKLLPIPYPQSLWQIRPEAIAQQLEQQAPIAKATVTRQLFPPSLKVQIQERIPVAVAISMPTGTTPAAASLVDAEGHTIPLQSYTTLNRSRSTAATNVQTAANLGSIALPTLKVIGMRDQYRSQWAAIYQAVNASPVKISEIDWQQPTNLILKTELGVVHCGSYSSRFNEQLRSLDRMRQLTSNVNPTQIAYIDLRNPDTPLVQMAQDTRTTPTSTP